MTDDDVSRAEVLVLVDEHIRTSEHWSKETAHFVADLVNAIRALPTGQGEGRLRAALRGCIEHMEWSTPQGAIAYEAARDTLKQGG